MLPTQKGSVRLFRFTGIDVFLHWSWFLVAVYSINSRSKNYSSLTWNVLEYLALFLIVLLHEFGHALACRQVGGQANQIVLWPLGGVAYVSPPVRPGATLWSIAAGPLVNVVLTPVLFLLLFAAGKSGWENTSPDAFKFLGMIFKINLVLMIFNLLPVYPLDGGQILRSLLWFVLGRARSLMVAAIIGLVGVSGFIVFALYEQDVWLGVMSAFILMNCWRGFLEARVLLRLAAVPRREGWACPDCKSAPPEGAFWGCGKCRKLFDTFATQAVCPYCGAQYGVTQCLDCGTARPVDEWRTAPPVLPPPPPFAPR